MTRSGRLRARPQAIQSAAASSGSSATTSGRVSRGSLCISSTMTRISPALPTGSIRTETPAIGADRHREGRQPSGHRPPHDGLLAVEGEGRQPGDEK